MRRFLPSLPTLLLLTSCAIPVHAPWDAWVVYESTYQRVLAQAQAGDAESQNAVGFMLFRGEGAAVDPVGAKLWFERSATQGNERAQRNLAYLNASSPATPKALAAGTPLVRSPSAGESAYGRYCGGCHGAAGIAAYENSPSFAFGERLHKSDAVLMRSIVDGMQEMPGWGGKLEEPVLREVLAHVRTLPARYEAGIGGPPSAPPPYVYLFGRMEERRLGIQR